MFEAAFIAEAQSEPDGHRQNDRPRHAPRRIGIVRGAERADGAGDDSQERREERERPREAEVGFMGRLSALSSQLSKGR